MLYVSMGAYINIRVRMCSSQRRRCSVALARRMIFRATCWAVYFYGYAYIRENLLTYAHVCFCVCVCVSVCVCVCIYVYECVWSAAKKHTDEGRGGRRDPGVRRPGAGRSLYIWLKRQRSFQGNCAITIKIINRFQ